MRCQLDPKALIEFAQSINVAWLALVVATISVIVAFTQYRRNIARARSADYLALAVSQFERAHAAFSEKLLSAPSKWAGLPAPDRVLWLTVARMLRTAQAIGEKITEESHRDVYKNARFYWRMKLHELLAGLDSVGLDYFAETPKSLIATGRNERMPLSDKSLKVVIDFLEWPVDEPDPIAGSGPFTEVQIDKMKSFTAPGVGWYIEAKNAILHGPEDRRAHWRANWPKRPE